MCISSKGRYGLRAMVELTASAETGKLLKSKEIAARQQIPAKYLEQIISILRKNNLVLSVRGAEGGYRLSRPPEKITVYEVLTSLEGELSILEQDEMNQLGRQKTFWSELDEQVRSFLTVPLTDFVKKSDTSVFSKDIMYYI